MAEGCSPGRLWRECRSHHQPKFSSRQLRACLVRIQGALGHLREVGKTRTASARGGGARPARKAWVQHQLGHLAVLLPEPGLWSSPTRVFLHHLDLQRSNPGFLRSSCHSTCCANASGTHATCGTSSLLCLLSQAGLCPGTDGLVKMAHAPPCLLLHPPQSLGMGKEEFPLPWAVKARLPNRSRWTCQVHVHRPAGPGQVTRGLLTEPLPPSTLRTRPAALLEPLPQASPSDFLVSLCPHCSPGQRQSPSTLPFPRTASSWRC